MKKRFQKILGAALSAAMVMTPMMETLAANNFDAAVEDVAGRILFPGDSISGVEPVYLGPDGTGVEFTDGKWTNDTAQAYDISAIEGEGGGVWLEPKGYVLTVNGGTSKAAGTDGSDTSNHYKAKDGDQETSRDVAYYSAWSEVTVIAGAAPEGQVFDHWEVVSANVSLDTSLAETNFTMAEDEVTLEAVYAQAPAATEAPVEEIPQEPGQEEDNTAPEGTFSEEIPDAASGEAFFPGEDDDNVIVIGGDEAGAEANQDANGGQETGAAVTYTLTVENGAGSGEYEAGDEVTITADQVEGMAFAGWYTDAETVWLADAYSAETTFYMPAEPVTVAATYTEPEAHTPETVQPETTQPESTVSDTEAAEITESQNENGAEPETTAGEEETAPDLYTVDVEFGEGGGSYEENAQVTVYADAPEEGQEFAGWTTSENLTLADSSNEEAVFTMPAENVKLTATYKAAEAETEPETSTEYESGEPGVIDVSELETEAAENNASPEENTEAPAAPVDETEMSEPETDQLFTEVETETEAETEAAVDAPKFEVQLSDTADITIVNTLTSNENGIPVSAAGETITVKATEYDDLVLDHWSVTKADGSQEAIAPAINPEDPYIASFIMPNTAVFVQAHYVELSDNEVQVVNGSGSGTYQEGDYVEISANDPAEGYRFKQWTVITGNVELDDYTSSETGFLMTDEAVQVKATYEVVKYTLTVENGSGDGSYTKGESVKLTADYPADGKVFAGWEVTSGSASVSSADRYYSSITMPASDVTVKATYKDGPSPAYNEIRGITSGGEYLKGSKVTFSAVGNGMGNSNPNPGDYRYRPSGYQIGSVSGSYNNAPYETSMSINGVGQYTLTVSYTKDIFDGNSWVATGTTDQKSVTFYVVNALSVQTGDNSPIIPLVIAAVAALAVIVILLVVRRRRK